MFVNFLKSKIHRAIVTDSNLNYEGSISIDKILMEKSNIFQYEKVDIYNINNGERFSTYVVSEKEYSGIICLNGAAARKVSVGDLIIIASYIYIETPFVGTIKPVTIVNVDSKNQITNIRESYYEI